MAETTVDFTTMSTEELIDYGKTIGAGPMPSGDESRYEIILKINKRREHLEIIDQLNQHIKASKKVSVSDENLGTSTVTKEEAEKAVKIAEEELQRSLEKQATKIVTAKAVAVEATGAADRVAKKAQEEFEKHEKEVEDAAKATAVKVKQLARKSQEEFENQRQQATKKAHEEFKKHEKDLKEDAKATFVVEAAAKERKIKQAARKSQREFENQRQQTEREVEESVKAAASEAVVELRKVKQGAVVAVRQVEIVRKAAEEKAKHAVEEPARKLAAAKRVEKAVANSTKKK